MKIAQINIHRNMHLKQIEIYKNAICTKIESLAKCLPVTSDVFFDVGGWMTEVINNSYSLGRMDEKMEHETE